MNGNGANLDTWTWDTHGPTTLTAPDGTERVLATRLRWSFSPAGTQGLEIYVDDAPVLRMIGPATPASFSQATIRSLRSLPAPTPTPPEQ